jgi:putative inorganic carbon (HCO3(-)) transporter
MSKRDLLNDYEPVGRRRSSNADAAKEFTPWPTAGMSVAAESNGAPEAVLPEPRSGSPAAPFKRGHALTYAGLFLFTTVLYFRPYELIPALSSVTSMAFWIAAPTIVIFVITQFSLEGNLTARPHEVKIVLLFVATALLSIPLALNAGEAWGEFNSAFIKAVVMFIMMVNVVRSERRLWALLWLGLAVSVFLSLNAIGDFRAGRLLVTGTRVAGVIGGMFGNPNDMALHLVTMVPIAIALLFTRRNPFAKSIYLLCAILLVAGIVVTFSRGGFLGLLGAGGVLAWKLGRERRLTVALCVVFAAIALFVFAPGDYGSRLSTITNVSSDLTGSSSQRYALLMRSILVSLRHPLLGIGMGNFHIVALSESVSHNAYTQVSAEMGLGALAVYLWFMIAPLRRLRIIERETFETRRTSRYYYLAVGLQAALVGYMVSSFFASVAYQFYVYYLVGYAVCLRRLYEAARAEGSEVVKVPTPAEAGSNGSSGAPDHPALAKPYV